MSKKNKQQNSGKQNVSAARRPDLTEIAVAQVQDKYSSYPSNGLTPIRLAEIFREADMGDVLRQVELFEEMEEKDPHMFSQLQTRKNAVTGLDYEIIPFDSDNELDKQIAEFVSNEINSIENFEDIEIDLLDAIGKGFAVSEIVWDYADGKTTVQDIKWRHQKRFFWDSIDDSFKVLTKDFPSGIILPENKFVVHRYKARSGHPSRAGVLRVVAWMYLFKNYDLKDWISFCEVFGMPLRLGKYAQGASDEDKASLMRALVQIGTDAAGIIPDGTTIDFITTEKTSSTDLYERLARYCDEQISKAILGQTLTSDSGGGSFAQSKTHNEVRHDLTVADCKALAATLRRDLIKPLVFFNFGENRRIPYLRYDCEEAGDLKETAEIITTLVQGTGLKVPTSYLYKKFSIPKPEAGEEIALPVTAAQTQNGLPMKYLPYEAKLIANVTGPEDGQSKNPGKDNNQLRVDALADAAVKQSAGGFAKVFTPVLEAIDKAGSLDELKSMFGDEQQIEQLFKAMDIDDVEQLLQNVMIFSNLEGRSVDERG